MSTTHPTNITTEWDDIQRKYGNLPKLEKEETNEEINARFVEITEQELLREARLKEWKKKLSSNRSIVFGTPVDVDADNFVEQITDASKVNLPCDAKEDSEMASKTGYYIPVLLLDDKKEASLLKEAWHILAKRYPSVKFTIGSVYNVLRPENTRNIPPSSILLYFAGKCILQKHASCAFQVASFELTDERVEIRLSKSLETLLNSLEGHLPLVRPTDSDSSSSESDSDYIKSSGKDLKADFLSKIMNTSGRQSSSKAYTSWILDKALGD